VYGVVRNTIVQLATPEALRGRVMSVQMVAQRGLAPAGSFVTGSLAAAIGAPGAIAVLALVATALVIWRGRTLPALRDYEDTRPTTIAPSREPTPGLAESRRRGSVSHNRIEPEGVELSMIDLGDDVQTRAAVVDPHP